MRPCLELSQQLLQKPMLSKENATLGLYKMPSRPCIFQGAAIGILQRTFGGEYRESIRYVSVFVLFFH